MEKYSLAERMLIEAGFQPRRSSAKKDGGPGSGNWGHAGREGKVGGSASGGGSSYRVKNKSGKYVGRFSLRGELPHDYSSNKTSLSEELAEIRNASYDDDLTDLAKERGYLSDVRTVYGGFGKSQIESKPYSRYGLDEKKIKRRETPREPGEEIKNASKYLTKDAKAIAKAEGDEPGKMVDVRYTAMVMEDTGLDSANAAATVTALDSWKGYIGKNDTFTRMRAEPDSEASKLVEQYIARSPKISKPIYRGIKIDDQEAAKKLIDRIKNGDPFTQNGLSSWSGERSVADEFANGLTTNEETEGTKIVFVNKSPKNAASISHLSAWQEEDEVVVSGFSKFKATKVTQLKDGTYEVEVDEY